jgi:predicted nucleic acid-binding protein
LSSELRSGLRRYELKKNDRPLQRRPDSALDFLETTDPTPPKLLYDTTVYIDILRDVFPLTGDDALRAVAGWHSPVTEAELAAAAGLLDPSHPQSGKLIDQIADIIDHRPRQRTVIPDATVWREAGILSGILARRQGYDKGQRRRLLNDALLFVTARQHGLTLLTRNLVDFDLFQQLDPAGRVLFYRI